MKRTRGERFVAMLILTTLLAARVPLFVHAATLTNDKIRESEESKKKAEEEKNSLKNSLTDVKSILTSLENTKNDLENYIRELDSDLEGINEKIDTLNRLISDKEFEIETTERELEEAKEVEEAQYNIMKRRVKFIYERGDVSTAEMLLSSKSFVEFLNKAEFISRVSAYDKRMLDSYILAKETVAAKEEELKAEKEGLETAREAVKSEQDALETLMEDKEQEITAYEGDISNKEAAIAEYEAMIAEQDQIIKDLEAAILEEKKRLLAENRKTITYDGGQFKWPAPSYTRISDDYGTRVHPILGNTQFHNGVDMAAPSGSPILAAYDGEVIAASYSPTMGNYIMIDHGDGLITIYMHASSVSVGQGTMVARGEQIGCVGSTGRSTGPHLHFSVRENGAYVSPWNYLS
ncbi:MAG: peptidoglycan DD-metalloendopeptidase family protein [Lachnospiraceae bacterium]|nr:peptidoglycan DD-metalloendopeptidase family protein [Lachnospiraceae bacterium]